MLCNEHRSCEMYKSNSEVKRLQSCYILKKPVSRFNSYVYNVYLFKILASRNLKYAMLYTHIEIINA
jgi:hypothetical protein